MAGEKPSRIGRGPGVKSECWLRSSQSAGGSRSGPDPRCGPPADPASVRGFGPRLLPAPRRRREGFALLCRCHDDVSELPSSTTESAWLRGFYFFLFLPSFPLPKAVVKRKRCREPLGAPRLLSCWIPGGGSAPTAVIAAPPDSLCPRWLEHPCLLQRQFRRAGEQLE